MVLHKCSQEIVVRIIEQVRIVTRPASGERREEATVGLPKTVEYSDAVIALAVESLAGLEPLLDSLLQCLLVRWGHFCFHLHTTDHATVLAKAWKYLRYPGPYHLGVTARIFLPCWLAKLLRDSVYRKWGAFWSRIETKNFE